MKIHLCVDYGWPADEQAITKCGYVADRDRTSYTLDGVTCWTCKAQALKKIEKARLARASPVPSAIARVA